MAPQSGINPSSVGQLKSGWVAIGCSLPYKGTGMAQLIIGYGSIKSRHYQIRIILHQVYSFLYKMLHKLRRAQQINLLIIIVFFQVMDRNHPGGDYLIPPQVTTHPLKLVYIDIWIFG